VTTIRLSGQPGGADVAVLARQLAVREQRRDDREPAEEVS
jgi:hypothetical protein